MISNFKKILLTSIIFFLFVFVSLADAPPPPGSGPSGTDPPVGGGTPIGSGIVLLISLGAGYGIKKVYNVRKNSNE